MACLDGWAAGKLFQRSLAALFLCVAGQLPFSPGPRKPGRRCFSLCLCPASCQTCTMLSKLLAAPARREWAGMGVRTLAKFDFEGPTSPNRSSSSFWRAEISSSSLLIISALRLALWPALPRGAPGSARWRGKCGSERAASGAGTLPLSTAPGGRNPQSPFRELFLQAQGDPGSPGWLCCGFAAE